MLIPDPSIKPQFDKAMKSLDSKSAKARDIIKVDVIKETNRWLTSSC